MADSGLVGPVGRRLFLLLTGEALTAPAHEWLLARPAQDVARPGRTAVSTTLVDRLDAVTAELRRLDDEIGTASLLEMIRAQLRYVVSLIQDSRYPETLGRRLHATAAELLRLAGWSCFEANRHPQAQRYWIAALHTAHTAGDRALCQAPHAPCQRTCSVPPSPRRARVHRPRHRPAHARRMIRSAGLGGSRFR